jgi:lipocalin
MSDIMSILQNAYASAPTTPTSNKPYTNVDPQSYQGSWSGTYSNNQKFEFTISDVNGFRAQVKYQSGSTVQYQQVLIRDSSFRIGDTKFSLTGNGRAQIKNAVTDPATGNTSLVTSNATQS